MSRALLLPSQANLIEEVRRQLTPRGNDFSSNLVIFPGKRPAHFLRRAIALDRGRSFLPPRTRSIDQFVDERYRASSAGAGGVRDVEPVDAVAILYDIHLRCGEPPGQEHFRLLDDFLPLGMMMFSELEELHIAHVPLARVREVLGLVPLRGIASLSFYYEEFYRAVAERSLSTRAVRYRRVADELSREDVAPFDAVILAGFYALTGAEKIILRTLLESEKTLLLAQNGPGIEEQIAGLGVNIEHAPGDGREREPEIFFHAAPDSHGQVLGLTGMVNERIGEGAMLGEETAIVLPSSGTLFPVLHQTLALLPAGGYNISLGYPIDRTPVYGFLNSLLTLAGSRYNERWYAPDYLRFVLHPYTKNIRCGTRTDSTRILFHTIEEAFSGDRSRTYFLLEDLEADGTMLQAVHERLAGMGIDLPVAEIRAHLESIHTRTLRCVTAFQSLGGLAERCIDVLTYIYAESTAHLHPYFHPFVETMMESLHALATSLLRDGVFGEMEQYLRFLRRHIAGASVPFEGTPLRGAQVLGFLETRSLQFEQVYLLDAQDDVLPGGRGADLLLPQKVRGLLGLETASEREHLAAYYFHLLTRGAQRVHLFYSASSTKGRSRFIEKLIWERQQRDRSPSWEQYVSSVRYDISLANEMPREIEKSASLAASLRDFTFSATALDAYLTCPIRFYYAHVLRMGEREEITGEIEQSELGTLVHSVLAGYFRTRRSIPLKKERLTPGDLDALLDNHFAEYFGSEPEGRTHLVRRQIRHQLHRFLEHYQIPLAEAHTISIAELESPLEIEEQGFRLRGFLDRVERRDGRILILDYKTGSNEKRLLIDMSALAPDERSSWDSAIGSLQMPLYMLLYARSHGVAPAAITPAYLMLGLNELDEQIERTLFEDDQALRESYPVLEKVIFALLKEIVDPATPFRPTRYTKETCPGCPFTYLCGTQWARGWEST